MELNSFSIFLTVVEEMNFTRAAEKLYITQQSLSGHIKRLETIYGVTLFQRRPILKLTPEGKTMEHFARQMIASESSMVARFADISQNCDGILNIGISRQRSQVFFPGIWSAFHQRYPNISIQLHERSTKFLLEELQAGQLDLMIGLNLPRIGNLDISVLTEEYNCCLINERLLEKYFPDNWREMLERFSSEGVNLLELKDLPLIMFPNTNAIRRKVDQVFYKAHAMPKTVLETNEQGVIFTIACYGDGVGIVTPAAVYSRVREPIPPTCHLFKLVDLPSNILSIATRNDLALPKYVDVMKSCIIEEFGYYSDLLKKMI